MIPFLSCDSAKAICIGDRVFSLCWACKSFLHSWREGLLFLGWGLKNLISEVMHTITFASSSLCELGAYISEYPKVQQNSMSTFADFAVLGIRALPSNLLGSQVILLLAWTPLIYFFLELSNKTKRANPVMGKQWSLLSFLGECVCVYVNAFPKLTQ